MTNLTLKNIPDDLYSQLKKAADLHHRSLNSEILYCVEQTLGARKFDISEHLAMARNLRRMTEVHPITDDELNAAKNLGRP